MGNDGKKKRVVKSGEGRKKWTRTKSNQSSKAPLKCPSHADESFESDDDYTPRQKFASSDSGKICWLSKFSDQFYD